MGRLAGIALLCIVALCAAAQSEYRQRPTDIDAEHTAWMAEALHAMQTLKAA